LKTSKCTQDGDEDDEEDEEEEDTGKHKKKKKSNVRDARYFMDTEAAVDEDGDEDEGEDAEGEVLAHDDEFSEEEAVRR